MTVGIVSIILAFFAAFIAVSNCQVICPPNETWSACATPCPATCSQIIAPLCVLPCVPSCVCNLGFVREEMSGFCVSVLQCLSGPPLF